MLCLYDKWKTSVEYIRYRRPYDNLPYSKTFWLIDRVIYYLLRLSYTYFFIQKTWPDNWNIPQFQKQMHCNCIIRNWNWIRITIGLKNGWMEHYTSSNSINFDYIVLKYVLNCFSVDFTYNIYGLVLVIGNTVSKLSGI